MMKQEIKIFFSNKLIRKMLGFNCLCVTLNTLKDIKKRVASIIFGH